MLYFAYGSNLDRRQMAERCPEARVVGVAHLPGHRLSFPRRSPVRHCATASIEPAPDATVWGALYDLTDTDLARLDAREGYVASREAESRYRRVTVAVVREDGTPAEAAAYVAVPTENPGLPSAEYLAHFIAGAADFGLPEEYRRMLAALATEPAA